MLVIRKYVWREPADASECEEGRGVEPLPAPLATPCPTGVLRLISWHPPRQLWDWTIFDDHIRLAVDLNLTRHVPREKVDRFLMSYVSADVFTIWGYGTFDLPTRIVPPRSSSTEKPSEVIRCPGTSPGRRPQAMEFGTVFGSFPRQEIVHLLRKLGYLVDEVPWGDFLAERVKRLNGVNAPW